MLIPINNKVISNDFFKIGEFIFAYRSGLHKIIDIEERDNINPIIYYQAVLSGNEYKVPKSKIVNSCDAKFCQKVTSELIIEIRNKKTKNLIANYDRILNVLEGLNYEHG